jgi:hypothetical protein
MIVFVSTKAREANSTSGGAVSCTVGQWVYTNPTFAGGSLKQGISQSIEFVLLNNPKLTT